MKISGSWASLLRGVSQQAPEVRQSGQHGEQVNMLSDPITGLTRRQGTRRKATATLLATAPVGGNDLVSQGYRKVPHVTSGKEYVLWMREENADVTFNKDTHLPPIICYNKTDNTFHAIDWADSATNIAGGYMGQFGITAAVSLGKFFVFAVRTKLTTMNTDVRWIESGDFTTTARAIVWIRGGAFDRTYAITLANGSVASFTTPAAGDSVTPPAASQISPQYIAQKLAESLTSLGFTVTRNGSHIMAATAQGISVSDGGDGSLIRGSYTTLDSVDKLPIMGMHGQIIRIQAGPDAFFYVEAIAKTGQTGILTEVRWIECAGEAQASGINHFYVGTITDAGTIRMASHPAVLNVPNPPVVVKSTAGDRYSNPAPSFLRRRQITYLGVFQDRLMIGAGAALAASAAGDYFNWFRSTMLTVPAKDGFEMIAQGGEDDFLRHSVPYSKNLVVFGDKRQYIIAGTSQLTPLSVNMAVMTTYADAATVPAVAAGGQIYYGRDREGSVGIHQIQPGAFVDSAESFPASSQIGTYIPAPIAQIEVVPGAPAHLLVRTRSRPRSVFTFSYLDQPDGRKQDAWSRWDFHPSVGACIGVESTPDGVLVFWTRLSGAGNWVVVADILPMATGLTDVPFFDSARPYLEDHEVPDPDQWAVAFNRQSERFLIGGGLDEAADLIAEYPTEASKLWLGLPFSSYVIPTNPYIRDDKGLAILTGRTVARNYSVNMRNSSGMVATVTTGNGSKDYSFNARVLGDVANQIGKVPITSGVHSVPIGREVREFEVKLAALKWYPFTLIGMEWTGQSFNRTPRA